MFRAAVLAWFLIFAPLCALADSSVQPPPPAAPAVITLGESTVQLNGPWSFRTGDDPAWSSPDLDDSAWDRMDLTPAKTGITPGWTRMGYPDYSGFAWYRLHLHVADTKHRLALKMPEMADDAYQVFVNGQMVGELGRFGKERVTAFPALPEAFPLPKDLGDGNITIAIRAWMDSATRFNSPDAGGLRGPVTLGYASVVNGLIRLDYDDMAHFLGGGFLEALILFMALLMTTALFCLDPEERSYLWLAFVCVVALLGASIVLSVNFTPWLGQTTAEVLTDVLVTPARIGLWVLFWGYWFRLDRIRRLHQEVWPLVGILIAGTAMLRPPLYGQAIPLSASTYLVPLLLVVKLLLGALLFVVAYDGFLERKTEGWMAGFAVALVFVANYQHELRLIHVPIAFDVLGFAVSLGTIATVTSLLIITVMLLRRFIQTQAQKEQWKLEIEQAQQVQQVLIPQTLPQVPGLTIFSEYRPAREVGGDFFQIIPVGDTGSALFVVGDVTGKGVQAGMLVALIMGAIRTAALHSNDPLHILAELNGQLCDRHHAVATCLILRIDADGTVVLAGAGQLPPYLNGAEVAIEGAFPLGLIAEADFSSTYFTLQPGDILSLMSDGVAEAQDAKGNLFGFERITAMLAHNASAAEIAAAAQSYGQEDDILVLQIQREPDASTNPVATSSENAFAENVNLPPVPEGAA